MSRREPDMLLRSKQGPNAKLKRKVSHQLHGLVSGAWDLAELYMLLFKAQAAQLERQAVRVGKENRRGVRWCEPYDRG